MRKLFLFLLLPITVSVFCQTTIERNDVKYNIHIRRTATPIKIDGILNEDAWQKAESAENFWQNFPYDSSTTKMPTIAKVCFDDNYLYISAICMQPRKYVVQSLRRDYPNGSSDIFFVHIDPFRDNLNGFYLAVTPFGVQKEGLIFNGSDNNFDWDNKWFAEATRHDDKYIIEMAIPFKTLRYKLNTNGKDEWNINFCRNNLLINERSSWAPIPRNFRMIDINFAGKMIWDQPPPQPGNNISIIPFAAANQSKDNINNIAKGEAQAGFDAKVAITPSLNLDLTFNPDFAQAEVDRQVTNLSRFELFFPERRQFFLENNDLFGSFGYDNINPFFSRRIGLGRNVNNGQNVRVPIIAGARLSGRINKDWRVGFLNMQTAKSNEFGLPATNFTVAAIQRRVGVRNNIGLIAVNKNELNNKNSTTQFNRVVGLDYNMASSNGKWQGKAFVHKTFTPKDTVGQYAMAGFIFYNSPNISFDQSIENIGTNYKADVGFVPRNGYLRSEGSLNFITFAKGKSSKWLNNWRIGPDYDLIYGKKDKRVTDLDAALFYRIGFQNGAEINGALIRLDYTYLFNEFDPTNTGGMALPDSTSYTYLSTRIGFRSNPRNNFFFSINNRIGNYFNGNIFQLQSNWALRVQPLGIFSIDINYTRINLPKPFNSSTLWLVGPRAELSFTRSVFLNAFFQYNNQINNFNANIRLQWRFKPVSDFFLVYTDNYFATDDINTIVNGRGIKAFQNKNRAIVAKLTYWFNL